MSKWTREQVGIYEEAVADPEAAKRELSRLVDGTEGFSGVLPMVATLTEPSLVIAVTGCGPCGRISAERIKACWNALAGEPDVAEFVAAVRELARATEQLIAELSSVQLDAVQEGAGVTNRRALELRRDESRAALSHPSIRRVQEGVQ